MRNMSTLRRSATGAAGRPLRPVRSPADPRAGRIPGLDGLRAIAVVAVLAFHLWPTIVPGGYLGVDVFFVISGFLITTLLLRERRSGGATDLVGFWRRRIRRLIPALVLVVVTSIAVARVVSGGLLVNIHRQVLGAATFSTNWVEIIAGGDYFDQTAPSLFLTFWSLAVEEQFYLLWPMAFVVMVALVEHSGRRRHVVWPIPVVLGIGSAVLMALMYESADSASRVYYGTDTHSFGIMFGVALAFAFAGPTRPMSTGWWKRSRPWLGPVALVGLIPMIFLLDSESSFAYRGGIVLASLLTLVVVAVMPGEETLLVRLFHARPLVWIGERSYGIYLWHWPVLLILTAALPATAPGELLSPARAAAVLGITFGLSELSFRFIEVKVIKGGFAALWSGAGTSHASGATGRGHSGSSRPVRGSVTRGAPARGSLVPVPFRSDSTGPGRRVAFGSFTVLVCIALVGLVTAPRTSDAEEAVAAGQALIDSQQPLEPVSGNAINGSGTPTADGSTAATTGDGAETDPGGGGSTGTEGDGDGGPEDAGAAEVAGSAEEAEEIGSEADGAQVSGDRIIGLGDSVMSGVASGLYQKFPGIYIDAKPNRQWPAAVPIVDSLLSAGTMREVVVLQFGTNAGLNGDKSKAALRKILDELGPDRLVVLFTVVGVSSWVPSTNEMLRSIAAEHPNAVIADWNQKVRENPGLLHDDRTHPNMAGMTAYGDLLAETIASARR